MKKTFKKLDLGKKQILQLTAPENVLGGQQPAGVTLKKDSCRKGCSHVTVC